MKLLFSLILFSYSVSAFSQKTELFYDYKWNPSTPELARFYSIIENTDSGWFRKDYFIGSKTLQMQALFADRECKIMNGTYYYFHANSKISEFGRMIQNKKEGICIQYYSNGMVADSAFYKNGKAVGSRMMWYRNGYMSDSIYHSNDSMDVQLSWFENGAIAAAGYLLNGELYGKWKFYHPNGVVSAEEVYKYGQPISKSFYNEDGSVLDDTTKANSPAVFKNEGKKGWNKYLVKNLYWPKGFVFINGTMAIVVVGMTINEDGKPEDVELITPFHPAFDKIAMDILVKSPAWIPAMEHNRKVKSRFSQPVTFQQFD